MSDRLEATFSVVTPMFLGGAAQQADGLRGQSVIPALRFWWRAVEWWRFRAAAADDAGAFRAMHAEECRLFGAASSNEPGHTPSPRRYLFTYYEALNKTTQEWPYGEITQAHAYLLGLGLTRKGVLSRACLPSGSFRLRFRFLAHATLEDKQSLERAVWALGLLGGLGSRSRRALGSISIDGIENSTLGWKVPADQMAYVEILRSLLNKTTRSEPPFSAFSAMSRVDVSIPSSQGEAWKVLEQLGTTLQAHRSYRSKPPLYSPDHDRMRNAVTGLSQENPPDRSVFGLPHNYFFSSVFRDVLRKTGKDSRTATWEEKATARAQASLRVTADGEARNRRASPLFMHVHRFPIGIHLGTQYLLQSAFLADGDELRMSCEGNAVDYTRPFVPNWENPRSYLDAFADREAVLP